jgi:hypothetical protein
MMMPLTSRAGIAQKGGKRPEMPPTLSAALAGLQVEWGLLLDVPMLMQRVVTIDPAQ